jgi:hypothetical protein
MGLIRSSAISSTAHCQLGAMEPELPREVLSKPQVPLERAPLSLQP